MYPEISTIVAAQTQDTLIERAARAHRVRRARRPAPGAPRPASSSRHHLPRVGSAFRHWLAAGLL